MLNTIGPVWDGNEVWLITAGGAMFAAFPGMYATMFSGLYLPLLAILVGMIVRICAIEWRGKIDDPQWRSLGRRRHRRRIVAARSAVGSRVRRHRARTAGRRGRADPADHHRPAQPVHPARRSATTGRLFAFHGAVFIRLKTAGAVRDEAVRFAARLAVPVTVAVAASGSGRNWRTATDWTWLVLGVAAVAQLSAVMLVWGRGGDGWTFAFTATIVAAVVVLLFGSLYPTSDPLDARPRVEPDGRNASSSPYTLRIMSWAALVFRRSSSAIRRGRTGCSANGSPPTGSPTRSDCRGA